MVRRTRRPGRGKRRNAARAVVVGGSLITLLAAVVPAAEAAPSAPVAVADGNSSLVMVLDSSGSMADDDGSGDSRIESARQAVGTVVDSLPDGHPTGLRLYGADQRTGCDDTRLARPVEPLDRAAIKDAVAAVEPKGDTPIGLSLTKAAADLPRTPDGALGRRTILLISDGEDNCGAPAPCEVARQLGEQGLDLRIDAIGFQVDGAARKELQCVARAGHGAYYDAPDADALARELQRAARMSADGYRFQGKPISGGTHRAPADLVPGQYLDTLGAGETRWYAAELDAASTANLAVTAVPQPGVPVDAYDQLTVELASTGEYPTGCARGEAGFGQNEGAMPLTAAASRIPTPDGTGACDGAGRYLFSVSRASAADSDQARWPIELRFGLEEPLAEGVTPAQSEPDYGPAGAEVRLPGGTPKEIAGGTGFNDATELSTGVWKDQLLPAQTRWFRVPVGWGQQLRYKVELGNEPTLDSGSDATSFLSTATYTPDRETVAVPSELTGSTSYLGEPTAVEHGTVPVSWTNRWETAGHAVPVHRNGDYYIGVSLGPGAAEIAENAALGLVLRVQVLGAEKAGPQHGAPAVAKDQQAADRGGDRADSSAGEGAGWLWPLVAIGAGAVLVTGLALWWASRRAAGRSARTMTTRGEG